MSKPVVVLYHAGCLDGFTAAWSAWKALGGVAEYVPCFYGRPLPEIPEGAAVWMLDFSAKRHEIEKLAARAGKLRILDHHKTAQAELDSLPYATFDMEKSGARLAREYFFPDEAVPTLVRYVEDHDLWKFELQDSREIHAYISSFPANFNRWDCLAWDLDHAFTNCVTEGRAVLRSRKILVGQICDRASMAVLEGERVPIVNGAFSLSSDVCQELLRRRPDAKFAAAWFINEQGTRIWSLRSRPGFDVSEIARARGGGGHAQAAGFEEPGDMPLPEIITREAP